MKVFSVFRCFSSVLFLAMTAFGANGADPPSLPLESLIGKYEGIIQVDKAGPIEHEYQTEVVSVDRPARTVSLTANCLDCGVKNWKRSNCEITGASSIIRFICRGPSSNEEYIFDGEMLKATGFGHKYPYSIRVTKVSGERPQTRR